jgi:hypothetical protein
VSSRAVLRALVFAAVAGCGLDLGGEQFAFVPRSPSGDAPSANLESTDAASIAAPDAGLADAETSFDMDVGLQLGKASPDAAGPAIGLAIDAGPEQDAAGPEAASPPLPLDGAPADADLPDAVVHDGASDGGTPCDRLMRCCQSQFVPLVCISAQDGGDAGSCESLLASFQAAGLCLQM